MYVNVSIVKQTIVMGNRGRVDNFFLGTPMVIVINCKIGATAKFQFFRVIANISYEYDYADCYKVPLCYYVCAPSSL